MMYIIFCDITICKNRHILKAKQVENATNVATKYQLANKELKENI